MVTASEQQCKCFVRCQSRRYRVLALLSSADCLAGFETQPSDVKPFHGVNKWPSEEDLPGFRETITEYHKEMSCIANRYPVLPFRMSVLHNHSHFWESYESMLKACFRRLVTLLAMALGLPKGFFDERFSTPVANVRAVHYLEGQPSNPEAGIFGVGETVPHLQSLLPLRLSHGSWGPSDRPLRGT